MKLLGIISVDFDVTDQLLMRSSEAIHQLFVDFKEAYDSVRREVFYNILIEFWVPMKLLRLIKKCLNEIYGKVHIGIFPIQNAIGKVQENQGGLKLNLSLQCGCSRLLTLAPC
jgi:hypothetical protein